MRLCNGSRSSFGSVVMTVNVSSGSFGRGTSPALPQAGEGVRRAIRHRDRKRLLCLGVNLLVE
jgi:hypothetical protein